MNRSITFRTQLLMNIATLLLVATMLLVSHTFANPPAPSADLAATIATAPSTISYQGHLTDANGQPINTATPMTFRLYTTATGGTALWTEERTGANAVPVTNGLFNVLLGSVTPMDTALFNQALWLGISINGEAEMTPREPFTGVPNGSITPSKAPRLVIGPADGTRVAHGRVTINRGTGSGDVRGFLEVSLSSYGFTETPTTLCSVAGSNGFRWQCHVEYEDADSFGIWVRHLDGRTDWTSVPVRWIAIGR